MAIFVRKGFGIQITMPSWVCRFVTKENIFGPMMTRLGKAASKAFRLGAPKIPWIGFGRTRGSKPRMVGTKGVPFWINPRDDSTIIGNAKTKGAKPSTSGTVCPFFGAGAPESIGDSFSSIMTKVRGAEGILHRCSRKYSSQSSLNSTNIALWLVLLKYSKGIGWLPYNRSFAWPLFQSRWYQGQLNSELVLEALYNRIGHVYHHYLRMSRSPGRILELLCSREQCDFPGLGPTAWLSKRTKGMRNPESFLPSWK